MTQQLYEILVPCQWNSGRPIRKRHHQQGDERVRAVAGGLTICKPATGQWTFENNVFTDRTIPVKIMCSPEQMDQIAQITIEHYEQLAVMYYVVATDCTIQTATEEQRANFSEVHR